MAKIENTELGFSFEIVEPLSVRDRLAYDSEIEARVDESLYVRLWEALKKVAKNWKSDEVALHVNLDEDILSEQGVQTIKLAGLMLWKWMQEQKNVPKK